MPIPAGSPTPRALLRDDVYVKLRDAIVDGTFEPGEQLRDNEIAIWLGVSRTPVREALMRLSAAGLVITAPGRSTCVSPLDRDAIRDAQSVVAAMHRLAVEEAVGKLTPQDLAAMRAANQRFEHALGVGDVAAALRADDEFHRVPVVVSGNAALSSVLDQFTPVIRRLEVLRFSSASARASVRAHARLVRLCAAGDVASAADCSHETWQSLAPLLESL